MRQRKPQGVISALGNGLKWRLRDVIIQPDSAAVNSFDDQPLFLSVPESPEASGLVEAFREIERCYTVTDDGGCYVRFQGNTAGDRASVCTEEYPAPYDTLPGVFLGSSARFPRDTFAAFAWLWLTRRDVETINARRRLVWGFRLAASDAAASPDAASSGATAAGGN